MNFDMLIETAETQHLLSQRIVRWLKRHLTREVFERMPTTDRMLLLRAVENQNVDAVANWVRRGKLQSVDVDDMSVVDLRTLARKYMVPGWYDLRQSELREEIKRAQQRLRAPRN